MNSLTKLKTKIESLIAAGCPTIKTFQIGYIGEQSSGQTDYDLLLLLPPKYKVPEPRNWNAKEYELHYFLIRQDKGDSGQDKMTPAERTVAWSSLDDLNKAFIESLMADTGNFQVVSPVTVDPNSGGPEQLLPDSVVWVEVTVTVRTNDC